MNNLLASVVKTINTYRDNPGTMYMLLSDSLYVGDDKAIAITRASIEDMLLLYKEGMNLEALKLLDFRHIMVRLTKNDLHHIFLSTKISLEHAKEIHDDLSYVNVMIFNPHKS